MESGAAEVFGKYQLVRRLAFGGMAEIFLGSLTGERGFAKKVVIKRILPQFSSDPSFVQMFIDEAVIAARLTHPNIVQIYDFGEVDSTYFIAMEWVDGVDLGQLIKAMTVAGQRLSPAEVAAIGEGICRGLAYAHDFADDDGTPLNIVHRDISPHNVMLGRSGEPKVMDFGIAKASLRATHTKTGMIKGKIAYMAPEHARGEAIDKRSDQFAVGLVLWECATGKRLFVGDSDMEMLRLVGNCETRPLSELRDDFPAPLEQIIMRALAPEAKARYPGLHEMEVALSTWRFSLGTEGAVQLGSLVDQVAPRRPSGNVATASVGTRRTQAVTDATGDGSTRSSQPEPSWDDDQPQRADWRGDDRTDLVRDTWSDRSGMATQLTASGATLVAGADSEDQDDRIGVDPPLPAVSEAIATAKVERGPWLAAGFTSVVAIIFLIGLVLLPRLREDAGTQTTVVEVPTAAAVPVIGALTVESDPPGASISIGGTAIGLNTPASIPDQSVGRTLQIGLHLVGYAPYQREILITEVDQRFSATLSRLQTAVAEPPSTATSNVTAPARVSDITAPKKRRADKRPKPALPGRLSMRARGGWVEVFLGKRKLGTTPLNGVEIPAGTHTLRLQNRDRGFKKTLQVTIDPGGHLKKTVDLE